MNAKETHSLQAIAKNGMQFITMPLQKNREVWNEHYKRNKSELSIPDENVVRFLVNFLRTWKKKEQPTFLDIGTGSGRHLHYAKQLGLKAYGLDVAKEAFRFHHHKDFFVASVEHLPIKDETIDIALSWGILHYLPKENAQRAVYEIHRILKKGGQCAFTIRSDEDTHLQQTLTSGDLKHGFASLYSKEEARDLLSIFPKKEYGFLLRQPVGSPYQVAHHVWVCTK